MKKHTHLTRLAALAAALLLGTCLTAAPAHAASDSAAWRVKGPGSAFTYAPLMGLTGAPGATLTHTVKLVNTGATTSQFEVIASSTATDFTISHGSSVVGDADLVDGYYYTEPHYTAHLAPGASETLTVRAPISYGLHHAEVVVVAKNSTTHTYIDDVSLYFTESNPSGGSGWDQYVKNGTQKPIGGNYGNQYLFANPMSRTGSATFSVTVRNNYSTPSNAMFKVALYAPDTGWTVTVKQGTTDVTSTAFSGITFPLAPGRTRVFKVIIKASNPGELFNAVLTSTGDADWGEWYGTDYLIATIAG